MQRYQLGRLYGLLGGQVGSLIKFLAVRAPLILLRSILPFLILAGVVWFISAPRKEPANVVAAVVLFGCYGLAGFAWGLQQVAAYAWKEGEGAFQQTASQWIDVLLDQVLARTGVTNSQIEIASVRTGWNQAIGQPGEKPNSWLLATGNWVMQRTLRARTAFLEQFLDSLEERGDTQVSIESLGAYLRDRLVGLAMQDLRYKRSIANGFGYAVIVIFVSLPLLTGW